MTKLTLSNLTSLQNETSAITSINNNFAAIVAQIDLLLSRDAESPNSLLGDLDANSHRIRNLPNSVNTDEPFTHGQALAHLPNITAVSQSIAYVNALGADFLGAQTIITVADDLNGANTIGAVSSNIGLVNAVGTHITALANLNTYMTEILNVEADAAIIYAVSQDLASINTVAGAIASVITAASSIVNVTTVANNIAAIQVVSSNIAALVSLNSQLGNPASNLAIVAGDLGTNNYIGAVGAAIGDVGNVANDLVNIDAVAGDLTNIDAVAGELATVILVPGLAAQVAADEAAVQINADNALGSELSAAVSEALVSGIMLSTAYANAGLAVADPKARLYTLYSNTTDGFIHRITSLSPADSETIQGITGAEQTALDALVAGALPSGTIASQVEAEAGANNTKSMTPLRTAQAIAALSPPPVIASQAEAIAGTENTKVTTSLRVAQAIAARAREAVYGPKVKTTADFNILSDGVTDDTAGWNSAIAAINAGTCATLLVLPGNSLISNSTYLDPIVGSQTSGADRFSIIGFGPESIITVKTGAGTVGRVFKLGTATSLGDASNNYAQEYRISNLTINLENGAGADPGPLHTDPVFLIARANTGTISDIWGTGWSRGFTTVTAGIHYLDRWNITPGKNAGAAQENFLLENTAVMYATQIQWNHSSLAGNANATGAFIRIRCTNGGNIDTVIFNQCSFQHYNGATGEPYDGRPYGVVLEKPAGATDSLTNVTFMGTVIDHTTVQAILFSVDAANTSSNSRWINIQDCRITTDNGAGILCSNSTTDTTFNAYSGLHIQNNYIIMRVDALAIKVTGAHWKNVQVKDNIIADRIGTGAAFTANIAYAIEMACSYFYCEGNQIGSDEDIGDVTRFQTAIRLSNTASDYFTVGLNSAPSVKTYLSKVAFTSVAGNRHIEWPNHLIRRYQAEYYEDFYGDSLVGTTISRVGSDADCAVGVNSGNHNGYLQLSTGNDAGATLALNGAQLFLWENFSAETGELIWEATVRGNSTTTYTFFIGFTDQSAALEQPFTISGTTVTALATDACGFIFDSSSTSDNFFVVSANTGSVQSLDLGIPIDTSHHRVKMAFALDGTCRFFFDDVQVGEFAAAVNPATEMTPTVVGFSRGAVLRTVLTDYIRITSNR